jgi:hypothetical protein
VIVKKASVYDLGGHLRLTSMDTNLKKLLDELPSKPPRSRLEPYREFIEELRARGWTYRAIAQILAEKCAVQVTGSGVHDFVRTRSRAKARQAENSPTKANRLKVANPVAAGPLVAASSSDDVQRRIAALKARNTVPEPLSGGFEYNPDEPLRLKQSGRD